jgi:hypothetical protein
MMVVEVAVVAVNRRDNFSMAENDLFFMVDKNRPALLTGFNTSTGGLCLSLLVRAINSFFHRENGAAAAPAAGRRPAAEIG